MERKEIHLWCTIGSHDKFYDMYMDLDGGGWTAYWGKRGTRGQSKWYPIRDWNKKYWEKIDKGYEEQPETKGIITYEEHLKN